MEQIIITHLDGSTLKLQSRANSSTITKASQNVELNGGDVIDITVQSAVKLGLYIGDKITIIGRDYTMNQPAKERKVSEREFIYDIQYEGVQYDLIRAMYNVNVDTTNNQIQDLNGNSLTGNMKLFLDVLIANANRVFPGKWSLGTYPTNTATLTESFSDTDNCLSVLQTLCSENKFNTEFRIVIDGSGNRTINIGATGTIHTYTFEHGKGKGIYDLTRQKVSSSNIITRLYVYGSNKNINTSKYRADRLCMTGKTKSQSFIENATAIAKYGVWEGIKSFDEIYPHRTGTITALGANELKFIDNTMDFDLNEKEADGITTKFLVPGTSAKVRFNTGKLAGYEFEIVKDGYDNATKQFTILPQIDENGFRFPSLTSAEFKFAIGDEYVLIDIYMPSTYITNEEAKLPVSGQTVLNKYSQPLVQYGLAIDHFFLKNIVGAEAESNIIWAGDYIPVKDTDLEVDKTIRVKGFTRDLLQDYSYNLTIADLTTSITTISRIVSDVKEAGKIIRMNNLNDPAQARRNYLSSQEILNMVFDPDGDFYTEHIKPASIDTTMLSVGAKSMQFGLEGTIFQPNYGGGSANKNRVLYVGGTLTHYAILNAGSPRTWTITDGNIVLATDAAYYVYAKCSRVGTGASILFSTQKITVESDGSYYHFLIGIINSVDANNVRVMALMYGFTTINGRFIKTGRIVSTNGNTYFDLDAGEFKGTFKFTSGADVETAVSTASTNASNAVSAASTASTNAANAVNTANSAATAASNAQTAANSASAAIQNIISDNVLSAAEKPGERSRWNDIAAEKAGINSQASVFGITTENTAYNSAYQSLANYLNNGTTLASGTPIWLSDANLGTDTVIVGSTYRTKWNDYFSARQTLLNAIAAKAKTIADDAKTTATTASTNAANAVAAASAAATAAATAQADATNSLNQITNIVSDNVLSAAEKPSQREKWNVILAEKTGLINQSVLFGISTEYDNYITSFNALAKYLNNNVNWAGGTPTWLADANIGTNTTIVGSTYRSTWETLYTNRQTLLNAIAAKAKTLADDAQAIANAKKRHFYNTPTVPYDLGDLWTDGTTLKRCTTAKTSAGTYNVNDWSLAVTYDNTKTVIDGGLVTSGTLQVAGDLLSILAGMTGNGTAATSVRFWAGASYENRATAPFRVLQDGSVVMTKATMSSANVQGNIEADSGSIGNWNIAGGGIINELNDAYIIARLSGVSGYAEARIGTNVVSPSTGLTIPAWFMNTIENNYGDNTALLLTAKHGIRNRAIQAVGDVVLVCGDAVSSKLNYMNLFTGSVNVISVADGLRVHARNMSGSAKTLYLPSLSAIRSDLGISTFSCVSASYIGYATSTYYVNKGNGLFVGDAIKYGSSAYQTIISIDRNNAGYDIFTTENSLGVTIDFGGSFTVIHEFSIEMTIIGEGSESIAAINVFPNGSTWMNNDGGALTSVAIGRGDVMKVAVYTRRNTMYYQLIHYKTA